jgi:hypothetical protein
MPDFQPTSEVMHLIFFFSQACPSSLIMILCHFLQNTVLPLKLGQFLTMPQAQSLPWDFNPQLWLN